VAFLKLVEEIVVVAPKGWTRQVYEEWRRLGSHLTFRVCEGGADRQDSVGLGLARLDPSIQWVFVHDAARPHVTSALIERVGARTMQTGACIPVLPVRDTVKVIREGRVVETLDRSALGFVQTPQGFSRELLVRAFDAVQDSGFRATDDAALVERLGEVVSTVEGEMGNVKVTWPEDLGRQTRPL
jgi:2-C-methyl-D-erythritol 4-phosphate cytidylyltransferase